MSAVLMPLESRDAVKIDRVALSMWLLGLLVLFVPVFTDLATGIWSSDEQGQGPVILALSLWLLYRRRAALVAAAVRPKPAAGWALVVAGLLTYWLGRSQDILMFATFALIPLACGACVLIRGTAALRVAAFPLFLLVFLVPLPGTVVAAVTAPLKSAVSATAAALLYQLGAPVARSGVVLMVGQYQLLVADACAGLNSMFTLEAIGLVYMSLRSHTALLRNVMLAVLLVPVAFCANVVRVMTLVMVTYLWGDAAGQGFVHGFAGLLLFVVAVLLMFGVDGLLGLYFDRRARR